MARRGNTTRLGTTSHAVGPPTGLGGNVAPIGGEGFTLHGHGWQGGSRRPTLDAERSPYTGTGGKSVTIVTLYVSHGTQITAPQVALSAAQVSAAVRLCQPLTTVPGRQVRFRHAGQRGTTPNLPRVVSGGTRQGRVAR